MSSYGHITTDLKCEQHSLFRGDFTGHSWVEIEVSDLERKKSKVVKALVDTGASLTALPEAVAKEIGIEPVTEENVKTGAGIVKVKRGRAWIKLMGKEGPFDVWISDFIDKVLLGVIVLESFGFDVDPTTGTLKERPLLLYKNLAFNHSS